jgi:hypothetical protein
MPDRTELRLQSFHRNGHQQEGVDDGEGFCSAIAAIAEHHVLNFRTAVSPPLPAPSVTANHADLLFDRYHQTGNRANKS